MSHKTHQIIQIYGKNIPLAFYPSLEDLKRHQISEKCKKMAEQSEKANKTVECPIKHTKLSKFTAKTFLLRSTPLSEDLKRHQIPEKCKKMAEQSGKANKTVECPIKHTKLSKFTAITFLLRSTALSEDLKRHQIPEKCKKMAEQSGKANKTVECPIKHIKLSKFTAKTFLLRSTPLSEDLKRHQISEKCKKMAEQSEKANKTVECTIKHTKLSKFTAITFLLRSTALSEDLKRHQISEKCKKMAEQSGKANKTVECPIKHTKLSKFTAITFLLRSTALSEDLKRHQIPEKCKKMAEQSGKANKTVECPIKHIKLSKFTAKTFLLRSTPLSEDLKRHQISEKCKKMAEQSEKANKTVECPIKQTKLSKFTAKTFLLRSTPLSEDLKRHQIPEKCKKMAEQSGKANKTVECPIKHTKLSKFTAKTFLLRSTPLSEDLKRHQIPEKCKKNG
ncbi:unnamed protein product [Phyllotreta striolata]|uniref:Uncharacterized protein n=1 Tax=Phyllotreta striolata TaxID=444603 RepID=A0A9P0DWW7_PHYSR|nr:unnamed protein product [Phyllotreta striolata]